MTYLELARKIKNAYKELKQNEVYKLFNVIWNNDLGESEITVENDAGFRAIIIGNTSGIKNQEVTCICFIPIMTQNHFRLLKK